MNGDDRIQTFEEFKNDHKCSKYFGLKCFINGCENPAEYECGDERFYCGVCEEHSDIKYEYDRYVYKKEIRKKWMNLSWIKNKKENNNESE